MRLPLSVTVAALLKSNGIGITQCVRGQWGVIAEVGVVLATDAASIGIVDSLRGEPIFIYPA